MHHHTRLIFVFLVETRFCHVAQAGLELLSSRDLPMLASQSTGITGLLGSNDSHASATRVVGITGMCHHTQLIFAFLVVTGFLRVGQAGLELLASGDLSTLALQSAGITVRLVIEYFRKNCSDIVNPVEKATDSQGYQIKSAQVRKKDSYSRAVELRVTPSPASLKDVGSPGWIPQGPAN
ncbi:Zinc finger protein [Plecturocebus cupreus]